MNLNALLKILKCIVSIDSSRLDRDVYGPICGQDWSEEWSEEVCAQMNFLGVDSSWNSSLVASEYFLLNGSLTVDDVSHVQEARSNYIQPCGTDAISFQCQSYSKRTDFLSFHPLLSTLRQTITLCPNIQGFSITDSH